MVRFSFCQVFFRWISFYHVIDSKGGAKLDKDQDKLRKIQILEDTFSKLTKSDKRASSLPSYKEPVGRVSVVDDVSHIFALFLPSFFYY